MTTKKKCSRVIQSPYVLVTAAYNEEVNIARVIEAVVSQTIRPVRWVIVSDASTDQTDTIVADYAAVHQFIQLRRVEKKHQRHFAAQVCAINYGCEHLLNVPFDYIGNLDADVSFGSEYFEQLLLKFQANPRLGLGGGYIWELKRGAFQSRNTNCERSVAHAVQLFRRKCYDDVGPYVALPFGGPDWYAELQCRMKGWHVQSFRDLPVLHHRSLGGAEGHLRSWYRQGRMSYSMGSHPVFEVARLARRLGGPPMLLGSLMRLLGFTVGYLRHDSRAVSNEVVDYLRGEERERLRAWISVVRARLGDPLSRRFD